MAIRAPDGANKQFFGGKGTKFLGFFQELLQEEIAFPKCVKWGLADKTKISDPIPTYKLKHIKIVFEKLQRNLRGNLCIGLKMIHRTLSFMPKVLKRTFAFIQKHKGTLCQHLKM